MAQYIDAKAMYEAGYGSKYSPSLKPQRHQMYNALLMRAGGWVINQYREAHQELKSVKKVGRKTANAIQIEMDRMGEQLSPQLDEALNMFKKEYDKGAKMSSMGLGRKRKEKGELMMENAWQKMLNLQKKLTNVESTMQTKIDSGLLEVGEDATTAQQNAFNPGLTPDQFLNSARLASGAMLSHLSVDMETGDILYATQEDVDVSEEAYNNYVNEMGGKDEGVLSYEDWQQLNENNPNIEYEQFERVDFGDPDDTSFQTGYDGLLDKAEERGNSGRELDATAENRLSLKVNKNVDAASDATVRSFFFGGDMIDGESLTMVTPAFKYLVQQGIDPGDANAEPGSEAHNNYIMFQSHLADLKGQDLSKGSPTREWLKEQLLESSKAYHQQAYDKYEEKQREKDSKGGDKTKEYGNYTVDGYTGISHKIATQQYNNMLVVGKPNVDRRGTTKYIAKKGGKTDVHVLDQSTQKFVFIETIDTNEAIARRGLDVMGSGYEENVKDKENALNQGNTGEDDFRFYQHTKTS